jgi:hypothetical protein
MPLKSKRKGALHEPADYHLFRYRYSWIGALLPQVHQCREVFSGRVLILGGDITGKAMVPIVRQANGSSYRATFLEETSIYVHRYVLHRPLSGIFLKKYGAPRVTTLFCPSLTYSFTKK